MASAWVPLPPEDDFLDSALLASQQRPSDSYAYGGSLNSFGVGDATKFHSFGGDGFLDASFQPYSATARGGDGFFSVGSSQRVPETPALRQGPNMHKTPQTQDCRLNFSFDTPSVPGGRGQIGLRSVTEIPEQYRSVFKNFTHFNLVQSKVFDDVMYTDTPLVASAPTGSGKTVIFELAIVRLLMQIGRQISSAKIVYVAPIKALCSERYEDWQAKFGPLGLRCCELTGDSQLDDYFELQSAQIVMTTPEKWDSMTRKWRDNKSLVQLVRLFLIDEVHQLNDEARGPTMEAIVSRMKTIQASLSWEGSGGAECKLRFIAVSATIPNIIDVAAWLGSEDLPALEYSIDESHRPVRLRRVVLGYPNANSEFKFDLSLNYRLSSVIQCYSDQKPTLVFCATRKGTQQAASTLVKDARFVMNSEHKQRLQRAAATLRDSKLRELAVYGVGYHHAGVDAADRKNIEGMFTAGELPVLFATSTLAMGVNLPAHLVVIKSTLHYAGGVFQEYAESQILQMIGRAGRPQFDTTATAVIMTRNSTKTKYEALLGGTQLIESSLHRNLIEHLNAEIVLHTITDVSIALDWLKSTFLYIRIKQNPKHYGIPEEEEKMEEKLQELCLKDLNLLESNALIKMEDGFTLQPSDTGRLMARYCVAFESMKRFQGLKGNEDLAELVSEISQCQEFEDVHLRVTEKRILNTLNKDKNRPTIRFSMSGKMKSTDMKVNCLIQAALGCLPVQEFGLNQDTQKIFRSASRLCKCLMELQILRNDFQLLLSAVLMHKCVQARLWENSKYVAKQLDKIGQTLSTTLVNAGLTTFDKIQDTNPRELEMIMNRHPPFGNQIHEAVSKLPRYTISVEQSPNYSGHQAELTVTVVLENHTLLKDVGSTAGPYHASMLLMGDADNHTVCKQRISDSQLMATGRFTRRITVHRASTSNELKVYLISLDYVGLDVEDVYTPRYTQLQPTHIGRTQPPSKTPANGTSTPAHFEERKPQGVYKPCSHRCFNKDVCGHECCRNGIVVRQKDTKNKVQSALAPSGGPPSTTARRAPAKRSRDAMGDYLSELHARTSCIPETPALKRLKPPSSSNYLSPTTSGNRSSSLVNRFSYTPSAKMEMDSGRTSQCSRSGSSTPSDTSSHTPNSSRASSCSQMSNTRLNDDFKSGQSSTVKFDDFGDFEDEFFDDFAFESDSDTDLPSFSLETKTVASKRPTVTQSSVPKYPLVPAVSSNSKALTPYSSHTTGHNLGGLQAHTSSTTITAFQKRPFHQTHKDHNFNSTMQGWSLPPPSSRVPPKCPPNNTLKSSVGERGLPLPKKLHSQMQQASTTSFSRLTKPPTSYNTSFRKAPPTKPHLPHTAPQNSGISAPVARKDTQPSSLRSTPTLSHAPMQSQSHPTSRLQKPPPTTTGVCSFFTAGPVSQEEEGDMFDSVFAGIF